MPSSSFVNRSGSSQSMQSEVMVHSGMDAASTPGVLKSIFRPRERFHFGALETIVLAVYTALAAWTEAHHIPWADEAQSWLLARDASWHDLFFKLLHYEGSPGLWHIYLRALCRMHISFTAMHWISAIIPVVGMWVFLRFSPFPTILRIVLPFSFYLLYQYAVIARSYVGVPLLVFIAAILFARPARNLIWLAVVLSLLSNLCAHGFLISIGFAGMIAIRLWQQRHQDVRFLTRKRLAIASCLFLASTVFAAWSAWPPNDSDGVLTLNTAYMQAHRAERLKAFADSMAAQRASHSNPHFRGYYWLQQASHKFEAKITDGLSNSWLLSLVIVGIVVAYLLARRRILDIVPYLLLQLLFWNVVAYAWHLGNALIAILGILWIDWPKKGEPHERAWSAVLTLALLAVALEQCTWSVQAIRTDLTGKYSGDQDAAMFLLSHMAGKKIAGFHYHCVGVLAYFPRNIFVNQPREAYWRWKTDEDVDRHVQDALRMHPDYIDVGFAVLPHPFRDQARATEDPARIESYTPDPEEEILASGLYRETHRFCGVAFSGHGYDEAECQAILEPVKP
jgi:hypothetical protein